MKIKINDYENKPCYVVDSWGEYQRDGGSRKNVWYIIKDESSGSYGYLVYRDVKRKLVTLEGENFKLKDIEWVVTERKTVEDGEKILDRFLKESEERLKKLGI